MKFILGFFLFVYLTGCINNIGKRWIITPPSHNEPAGIINDSSAIIPNGRIVSPEGRQIKVAPHPYGLILTNDDSKIITANSGVKPFSISIISDYNSENYKVAQIPEGSDTDEGILASVYMGLAVSKDNKILYVAGGQEGKIYLFDIATSKSLGEIDCKKNRAGRNVNHSYIGDMIISSDGSTIFAVDQIQFEVLMIDTKSREIINTVKVGRYPFGITLSPDEKEVYVANVGVFEYKYIESYDTANMKETSLDYPTSAYLSDEMREGIYNDSVKVPPLGDPNVPESFSVWTIDLNDKSNPHISAKTKTGFLVGELVEGIPAVGGASPNSVVATDKYVFVSNGNDDCISVIETKTDSVVKNIFLSPDNRIKHFRGIIPFGLALSPDSKRLYVAESGINAVGVINTENLKLLGHIPTGWFPSKLKVTKDGKKLIVANAKGLGSGPNAGPNFIKKIQESFIGNLMNGVVSIIDLPNDDNLKNMTEDVIKNNFEFAESTDKKFEGRKNNPVPLYPGEKETPIKYIVFISKENRTYDEIFGQVKKGNGLPEIARFGKNRTIVIIRKMKNLKM